MSYELQRMSAYSEDLKWRTVWQKEVHGTLARLRLLARNILEARSFFQDLERRLMDATLEPLSHYYLLQRVAVAVQRGNTASILGSRESLPYLNFFNFIIFKILLFNR